MRKIQNDCCDCAVPAYPCVDCGLKHSVHFYCDKCHSDIEQDDGVYEADGKDLCIECLREKFRKEFE